jgi:hypothetical protein
VARPARQDIAGLTRGGRRIRLEQEGSAHEREIGRGAHGADSGGARFEVEWCEVEMVRSE